MTSINQKPTERWTSLRANSLAALCLLVGIAGGWLIRGTQSSAATGSALPATVPAPTKAETTSASQVPNSARLREMADALAAPMLDKLKSDPRNADLLTSVGNVYYDAQQYPIAVDYYDRALKTRPSDSAVRTDMGTAYWYMGNADAAITEFNKALTYDPNKPNTLFNLGLVKLQGKKDTVGAVADWEKLLTANPNYEAKDKVQQMLAEAKGHQQVKP
jgi:tetratricopeptide (TPR) repeat protein